MSSHIYDLLMTIDDRIKQFLKLKGIKSDDLARETDIGTTRWNNARKGTGRFRAEEVEAICKLYPEYQMWIATNTVMPEAGQISPELEEIRADLSVTGTDT